MRFSFISKENILLSKTGKICDIGGNERIKSSFYSEHRRISNSCVGGMEEGKSHLQWGSPCARRPPPRRLYYEDVEGARTNSHPIRTTTVLTSSGSIPHTDQDSSYSETVKFVCCPGGCRLVCCRSRLMKLTSAHVRASV